MSGGRSHLTVKVPEGFDLARAVCSYGYFLLAPNRWEAAKRALHRTLHDANGRVIHVRVTQVAPETLRVACDAQVSAGDAALLRFQIARMLRLDEDLSPWQRLHPQAAAAGFGRLFRSPTLFEDMVKTITTCNVTWPTTIRMNALLCEQVGGGAYPTAEQIASLPPNVLQRRCKVGYRAERIVRLARDVVRGRLDLARFEDRTRPTADIYADLREIHGIGDYAASNLCQLLGRYDLLPVDSETLRHFRQHHAPRMKTLDARTRKRITRHYAGFAPYQFLAYWFELWGAYEKHAGDARQWNEEHAATFTAAKLNQRS